MKLFNFRAKVKIVGSIFFVAILLSVAVLGGTRIITDSSDNSVTFITNSNDGKWDATGPNLVLAVDNQGGNGTVEIPPGIYDLTASQISIADLNNLTIKGAGRGITILQNGGIAKNDADATYNVTIEDLTIDMNDVAGRIGINLATNSYNFCIRNVEIKNTNNNFLLYFSHVNNLLVENCIFYDGGLSVAADNVAGSQLTTTNDSTIFRNNRFVKENSLGGGLLTTGGTGNLLIEGNTFVDISNTSYAAISIENSFGACKDIQVFNNHIYGVGIVVGNNFSNPIESVEIANNIVKGNGPNPGGNGCIKGIGEKVIIQGNEISDTVYGILAGCPNGVAGEIMISNNILKNTNIYNAAFTSDRGIYIATSDEKIIVKVSDNIFTDDAGTTPYGVRTAAVPNASLYIENNILEGPFIVAPISISSTLDLLVLNNNRINGTPAFGSTNTKIIKDNHGYNYSYPNHFGNTTDYMDVNETGYLTLHGGARVERHADINAGTWIKKGLADPGTSAEGLFCTLDFDKATNETVYYTFHIPWRRCNNTDMEVSVYWFHDNNAADANKKVMWAVDYVSIEPGETADAINTTITQLSAGNHNTDAGELIYTTFTTKIIAGNLANHDNMGIRFYRVGTDGSDDLDEDARMISVHLHFTMDKLGEWIG